MPRPRRPPHPDAGTRDRLLAAASAEFAARGFAAASIDSIASAAGLTKAMIYYHFASKAALYREIVRGLFQAVGARVAGVAASAASPEDKIRQFIAVIAEEAGARPHFPPIWFREIAEGGAHLDAATLRSMSHVVQSLSRIIQEGVRAGRFRPVNPVLVHAGIVAPLLLFFSSDSFRRRLQKAGVPGAAAIGHDNVIAHIEGVALATLQGRIS